MSGSGQILVLACCPGPFETFDWDVDIYHVSFTSYALYQLIHLVEGASRKCDLGEDWFACQRVQLINTHHLSGCVALHNSYLAYALYQLVDLVECVTQKRDAGEG